jgi:hypothetical protein
MTTEYFDEKMETLPTDQLRKVQDHRLRWQVRRCWDGSEFYRGRFEVAGLTPDTFGGLADVERLPLLTRDELESLDPTAWLVAPPEWIDGWRRSKRLPRQQTGGDFVHETDRQSRAYWAAGTQSPYYPVAASNSRFPERVVPSSVLRRFGPPVVDSARRVTVRSLRDPVVGQYLAFRCTAGPGRHWAADQLLAEIVDPKSGRSVASGAPGELVVTDLVREASPLIRYRTGLQAVLTDEPCPCGRTLARVLRTRRLAR